jgi:hypothetical protein
VWMSWLALVGAATHGGALAEGAPPPSAAASAGGMARGDVVFPAFQIKGGITRALQRHRWQGLAGAAAGVGVYDRDRVWELTAGAQASAIPGMASHHEVVADGGPVRPRRAIVAG